MILKGFAPPREETTNFLLVEIGDLGSGKSMAPNFNQLAVTTIQDNMISGSITAA